VCSQRRFRCDGENKSRCPVAETAAIRANCNESENGNELITGLACRSPPLMAIYNSSRDFFISQRQ
jgi:hypothetical protein